jgi:hypothetical protein
MIKVLSQKLQAAILISWVALAFSGCSTIELVSQYDEVTDKAITALQKKTETHLESLTREQSKPKCEHQNYVSFYSEAKVDLSGLAVRTAAIPNNTNSEERINLMSNSIDSFEQLHKLACLSTAQIELLRVDLNRGYTAILKAELAKKRGK